MGEIAWVRKYRPSSFDDYMGDNVKNLVMNRFKDRNNIPNTIMLYGTRGTGKTSMARLLAKEIHCMNPIDGHSCGKCEMCEQINEYISATEAGVECFGIVEVDAATTTGKNDINDIIDDALIAPLYPLKHKILVLDECHMLSKAAQNSLLKVIEEPPPHLVFILCTTDPELVIGTIHSRMQLKIEVRKKSVDEIADKLIEIATKEKFHISREAAKIIAKKGGRIPRECINLLESIYKNFGEVTVENLRESLGDVSTDIYTKYFEAANTSLSEILQFNLMLKDKDIPAKNFISGLIRYMLDACYVRNGLNIEDYPVEFAEEAKKLFSTYRSNDFDIALQIMEEASRGLSDDDTANELLITTTAMKIGKIKLLSKGLQGEQTQAEKENNASTLSYNELLAADEKKQFDKIREYSATKEALGNIFKQMSDVRDSAGALQSKAINLSTSSDTDTSEQKLKSDLEKYF